MNAPCFPTTPFPPAPPFPANPSVGQVFGSWVWNGQNWAISPVGVLSVNLQVFMTSGMYQPSPGLVYAIVEAVGGGGGGGGAVGGITPTGSPPTATTPGWVCGGGGGSGGSYARSSLPASLLAGGVQVTIGAGGAGGNGAGVPGLGNSGFGQVGGITTFGALVQAPGGWGGGSNIWQPGQPGAISGGLDPTLGEGADPALDFIDPPPGGYGSLVQPPIVGQFGGFGNAGLAGGTNFYDPAAGNSGQSIVWGGAGGATFFAGTWAERRQAPSGQNGRSGHEHGVGGGGAVSAYVGYPANGGMGAAGVVLVTEYCMTGGQGQGQGECCPVPECGPEWGPAPWWPGSGPGWGGPGPWRR